MLAGLWVSLLSEQTLTLHRAIPEFLSTREAVLEARGKPRQPRPSHRSGEAEDGLRMVICNSGLLPDFRAQREASSGQWLVSLGWKHMRILVTLNVNLN